MKATTVRMPDDLAESAEVVARVRGVSVNQLTVDAITAAVDEARNDPTFMETLGSILQRDREIFERLAGQ
jgi:hypothetical protein